MEKRDEMLQNQIIQRGVSDSKVLAAIGRVPRHLFVPADSLDLAYEDYPLAIGHGQTISQPYIVAFMTEALRLGPCDRVLEVGTGSGYQAAVLAEIVSRVYSLEIIQEFVDSARKRLSGLGYENIDIKNGDGYLGWPEFAPYDAIIVTAAPEEIPGILVEQLKPGGRLIIPIGSFFQELMLVTKTEAGYEKRPLLPVRFVPMVK